jgi:hypothetical protein
MVGLKAAYNMRLAKMPATEHIISTFEILLYFSNAAYENKVTPRPNRGNSNTGTSASPDR